MIEVEKKFLLTDGESKALTQAAEFLSEKVFTDTYYDTADCTLTAKDIWLRERDGKWELKMPLNANDKRLVDQYDEMEHEPDIRRVLALPESGELHAVLAAGGYKPFCICKTTRRKYRKEGFVIDLDSVEFGDFSYGIGEIELLVKEKAEIDGAIQNILAFAHAHNLAVAPVRGKVIEYLKRKKPEHYRALVAAGVVQDAS